MTRRPGTITPLAQHRAQRGWTKDRTIHALRKAAESRNLLIDATDDSLKRQLAGWENGHRALGGFYLELFCLVYECERNDLFDSDDVSNPDTVSFAVTSHKFIPAWVGPEAAERLSQDPAAEPAQGQWLDCHVRAFPSAVGKCELYTWPFGIAMLHLVEQLHVGTIAELALWRRRSYAENKAWGSRELTKLTDTDVEVQYVLSVYWIDDPVWDDTEIPAALRIICIPRVLVEHGSRRDELSVAQAQVVERTLLRDGFDNSDIVDFGMKGVSHGYASWSGVVYSPIAPARCLSEDQVVACELAVQAVWSYCYHIKGQIEAGSDPVCGPQYGWRFLRGVSSRITTERADETSQHRAMREAIVSTSSVDRHLAQALDILRDGEGK